MANVNKNNLVPCVSLARLILHWLMQVVIMGTSQICLDTESLKMAMIHASDL